MESINKMTLEEKHDLVMHVIDSALKKGMGITVQNYMSFMSIVDHESDTKFFHINGMGSFTKKCIENALKYVSDYEPKKVVKHKVALLLTSESQLNEIHGILELKGMDYDGLKDFYKNPVVFFDHDPNDSNKIWMDMADSMELEYLIEQGWKFLGTFSQGKTKFLDAVS